MQPWARSEFGDMNQRSIYALADSNQNNIDVSQGIKNSTSLVLALVAEEALKTASGWLSWLPSLLFGDHDRSASKVRLCWVDTKDFSRIPKGWHVGCDGRHSGTATTMMLVITKEKIS